jgi:homoserine O-acetyltransferase
MKKPAFLSSTLAGLLPLVAVTVLSAQPRATLERHDFVIRNFRTESGVVLPEARIVYTTLGGLNADGSNAILLPSHYMANFNGYNWLIRGADADRALDPARDFLILTSSLATDARRLRATRPSRFTVRGFQS